MQCKICGAENSEGKKFCTQCGADMDEGEVLEQIPAQVRCSGCGKLIKADAKFCNECGAQQTNQEIPVQLLRVDKYQEDKQPILAGVVHKGRQLLANKAMRIGCIAGGIAIGLGCVGSCLIGSREGISRDEALLVCVDEDNETYIVTGKDKVHELGVLATHVRVAQDLSHIYYTQSDEEELYCLDINQQVREIDEDVLEYTVHITPDGKNAIYMKDIDRDQYDCLYGTLMYVSGDEVIEVEEEVWDSYISDNGEYIVYGVDDEIFRSYKGEEGEVLTLDTIRGVSNDGSVLGYDEDELVLETIKEVKVLGEDLQDVQCSSDLDQIYFVDDNHELYAYDGKEMQVIAEDVNYIEQLYNEGDLFEIGYVTEDEETYIVKAPDEHYEVKDSLEGIEYYYHPEDKKIYYLEDWENLHVATYGDDTLEDECIAKDVDLMTLASTRDKGVYLEDETLYTFGASKEPKEIAEDIEDVRELAMADDGYVWYLDMDDTLYYINKSGEPQEIADDIVHITQAIENSIYLLNDDGEVLKATKDKVDDEVMAEDVVYMQIITVDAPYIY